MTAFNLIDETRNVVVSVKLGQGRSLFYRMRIAFYVGSRSRERIWIVGWHKADGSKRIWVVDSGGRVKTYGEFDEKSQWLYLLEFIPFELVYFSKKTTRTAKVQHTEGSYDTKS